jgi:cytochrome c5
MSTTRCAVVAAAVLLCACGKPPAPAVVAAPADPKLARLYDQTCKACHTNPTGGAPQAGDRKAWQPRLAQGMDVLLQHAVSGYKGMPPLGSCMDCSEKEFRQLIEFMAK